MYFNFRSLIRIEFLVETMAKSPSPDGNGILSCPLFWAGKIQWTAGNSSK